MKQYPTLKLTDLLVIYSLASCHDDFNEYYFLYTLIVADVISLIIFISTYCI